ncbi:MAG: HD domain-containing protein [Candidatus Delongbacteria bacterium]|nr:HD domain-containing protein [Candidatus Delongbacteria bacterium]
MNLPKDMVKRLILENDEREKITLGAFSFFSKDAFRKRTDEPDYRPSFSRDSDRIIHSYSFARYFDKTQVFFWIQSDLHQHRMLHVQLVSKIARDIARALKLNEELTEAIALGHDIGHTPFGHDGEVILRQLTVESGIGEYHHNVGSVWFLQKIERQNLTLPVLDGILCHNGESHHQKLTPNIEELSWQNHDNEISEILSGKIKDPIPKTLEGCLVRTVDTISYISRDILEAERLGLLKFSDIPNDITDLLGRSNPEILNTLITDVIKNSQGHNYISYSTTVHNALLNLYKFNLENIYKHPEKDKFYPLINTTFKLLWDKNLEDLVNKRLDSPIYTNHLLLNLKNIKTREPEIDTLEKYQYAQSQPEIIVRDFLAGCTDQYFWRLAKKIDPSIEFQPKSIY